MSEHDVPAPPPPPGWWQASDGNWYPPDRQPGATPVPPPIGQGLPSHLTHYQQPMQIPPNRFGQNVSMGLGIGCGVVLVLVAAWFLLGLVVLLLA